MALKDEYGRWVVNPDLPEYDPSRYWRPTQEASDWASRAASALPGNSDLAALYGTGQLSPEVQARMLANPYSGPVSGQNVSEGFHNWLAAMQSPTYAGLAAKSDPVSQYFYQNPSQWGQYITRWGAPGGDKQPGGTFSYSPEEFYSALTGQPGGSRFLSEQSASAQAARHPGPNMGWMVPLGLMAGVMGGQALGWLPSGEAAAAAAATQSASLGSGLSLGAGGQTGLTLGGGGLGLTAPAGTWAIPEWSALAGGLGSGLSLNAGGEGLRYSNIPNLSSMGGGQGLTLPVEGGTLTEAGVIPASGTWGGASQSMSLSDAMRGLDQLSKMGGGTPALSEALSGALGGGETGLKLPALTTAETAPEINPATIPQFSGQSFFSDAPYMMSPYAGMTEGEAGKATEGPANERVVGQGSVGDNPGLKASLGDMFGSPMTAEGLQQRLWRAGGGYPFFGSAPDQGSLQQRIERLRRAYF